MLFLLLLMFSPYSLSLCVAVSLWKPASQRWREKKEEYRLHVCRPERGDPVWRWEVWDARSLVSDLLTAEMGPAQRSSLTSEEYSAVIV